MLTNPVFLWGYLHVLLASLVTGGMVMLAVSAWHLRHGLAARDVPAHGAAVADRARCRRSLFALMVGSHLGVIETTYQPMKVAAMEAQWQTCQPCSFSVFQIGGGKNDETPTKIIAIPHLLSLLADDSWDGQVVGLNELNQQYQQQYGAGNYIPNVFIQYWSMRVMAYLGVRGVPARRPGGCGSCGGRRIGVGEMVPARRLVGGRPSVPDEHRRMDADRERPAAVDRAGAAADAARACRRR